MQDLVNLEGKNVLVVEDDDMNYIYLSQIFKITKGNITRAKTGTHAKLALDKEDFDLILMDIQLPDISGNEIVQWLRQNNNPVPILVQTASRSASATDESLEAGCNGVLIKPFKINDFSEAVKSVLAK